MAAPANIQPYSLQRMGILRPYTVGSYSARTDRDMPTEYSGRGDPQRTIDLLWGVHRRRRGPKPSLSGEQVVTTAIQIADRDGLGGLSMRRLSDGVGVTANFLFASVLLQ